MTDATGQSIRPRIASVDLLRGVVMIVMVLDHVREFVGRADPDPTNLEQTSIVLFLTRWITHYCAPTFVFLAGTGAYLYGMRGKTRSEMSRFLFTRGLWLVFLELTVVQLGISFNPQFRFIPLTVIWAIGWSMIVLSCLVYLPTGAVAAFGVIMIASHNLFDGVNPENLGRMAGLWRILHQPGPLGTAPGGRVVVVFYPLVPWIGVTAAGYGFGSLFRLEPPARRRWFLTIGLSLTAAFLFIRGINRYGDPFPWSPQPRGPAFTVLSFLNCFKYPPSLSYLLMTLGPAITLLALLDRPMPRWLHPVDTFGRVPLFYYLLQWPIIHLMAIVVNFLMGRPYAWLFGNGPFDVPAGSGHDLPWVYAMWVVVLLLLYPPCAWFASLKKRRRDVWLSYF